MTAQLQHICKYQDEIYCTVHHVCVLLKTDSGEMMTSFPAQQTNLVDKTVDHSGFSTKRNNTERDYELR